MVKFYKNTKTNSVTMVLDGHDSVDADEVELKANSTDAATEKHVPVVTVNGKNVHVVVGSVSHPMTDAHYITFITMVTDQKAVMKKLSPSDKPEADFVLTDNEKVVEVYEFCNLHGLWVKTL